MEKITKEKKVKIPCGCFCGYNCTDDCKYWAPYKKDSNGRQYCYWYETYYYPSERQGCLSHKKA